MDDGQIVDLYWARAENAISETANKYGTYCRYIAYNILYSEEDSEECVNDAYLAAWNTIPPQRPNRLSTFLGKLTRNLALDRAKYNGREKRGGGQLPLALDELAGCVPSADDTLRAVDDMVLADCFDRFLAALPDQARKLFVRRYWHLSPVKELAADFGVSESKVKMTLLRARNELKRQLEKEGIEL